MRDLKVTSFFYTHYVVCFVLIEIHDITCFYIDCIIIHLSSWIGNLLTLDTGLDWGLRKGRYIVFRTGVQNNNSRYFTGYNCLICRSLNDQFCRSIFDFHEREDSDSTQLIDKSGRTSYMFAIAEIMNSTFRDNLIGQTL